ncbi:hypothetical protein [Flavobacterium foetidum]|uniref:hypothetical protein n=1 Tax=Flavobacterium foetidum TaxID=2026681 RepID=UPI001074CE8E|nr:hypothetical protein [Flavobacterium foetidum]KAF2510608.1 hypothetical protein E0W73_17975 [Flavobacterium foetidum]
MKKIGILIVMFVSFVSCSTDEAKKDEKVIITDYYGKWVQYADSRFADDAISRQFSYIFNKDNTFTKTRIYNNVTSNLSGTFEIIKNEKGVFFVLTYPEYNSLISNCTSGLKESFTLTDSGRLSDDARACDRSYEYVKVD